MTQSFLNMERARTVKSIAARLAPMPNGEAGGVPERVHRHVLGLERRAGFGGNGEVAGEASFDRVAAEMVAGGGREQRVSRRAGAFLQPGFEHLPGIGHQGRSPLLASLADAVHVGAGGERDVGADEGSELGDPQSGLDREYEHRVVASAGPDALVAGSEEGVDLGFGEVGDEVAFSSLLRDREHPLDRCGVLGVVQRHVREQRMDRREAVVAAADAVAASLLEVLQERSDQRRVELCDIQFAGRLAGPLGGELQQQPEGLAVRSDRVRARAALRDQPIAEVGLHRGRERAHRSPPNLS